MHSHVYSTMSDNMLELLFYSNLQYPVHISVVKFLIAKELFGLVFFVTCTLIFFLRGKREGGRGEMSLPAPLPVLLAQSING